MRSSLLWIALACIVTLLPTANSAEILGIFTTNSISHHSMNQPIMKGLAARGHNVTILSPFKSKSPSPNYTEILLGDAMPFVDSHSLDEASNLAGTWNNIIVITEMERIGCTQVFKSDYIRQLIHSNDKTVNLIIAEQFYTRCHNIIAEKLNVPLIRILPPSTGVVVSLDNGSPNNPAYVPVITSTYPTKMGFAERVSNTIQYMMYDIGRYTIFDYYVKHIVREEHAFGEIPSRDVLNRREALTFYNNYAGFINKPIPPNGIDIAGIHIQEAKPLPRDIQEFIDSADHGVVLFSLGSLLKASSMPPKKMEIFKRVFSRIPQRVLWRIDGPQKFDLPENVKIAQWFPQRDILENKNVRAFISHCGIFSTLEAIHTGVPIIALPFLFDQFQNANLLAEKEVAVVLNYKTLSEDALLNAVNKIINSSKYYSNMQKQSKILRDRPMPPLDAAIYWCEYILRHGGAPHLRSPGTDMPLYQYLLLDVIVFIIIAVILTLWLCKYLAKKTFG